MTVWENGAPLDDLWPDEREMLLRELVPPGLADSFFFDGELKNSRTLSRRIPPIT